jgi:hypothetical protein
MMEAYTYYYFGFPSDYVRALPHGHMVRSYLVFWREGTLVV